MNAAAPAIVELHNQVLDDLDMTAFAVGWWVSHLDTARRILVSDYLSQAAISVQKNLTEAALHFLEVLDFSEQESNFMAGAAVRTPQGLAISVPPPVSPHDELPVAMADLHAAGFFRAAVGALDCLGASIVGVAALRRVIFKCDLRQAQRAIPDTPSDEGQELQNRLGRGVSSVIEAAGPSGWLDWMYDFRNMLVHRGRRTLMMQLRPRSGRILGPDGLEIIRLEAIQQLPNDPDRSDIEVLLSNEPPVLTESATTTLAGLLATVVRVAEESGRLLLDLWHTRRARPDILRQPAAQWPQGVASVSTQFRGFAPGSLTYDPRVFYSHPAMSRRMRAAALDDDHRGRWSSFH